MVRSTSPRGFLTTGEVPAVKQTQRASSAEVKVVLARHCWGDIKAKAHRIFRDLGLDRTAQRNCVLLLFVVAISLFRNDKRGWAWVVAGSIVVLVLTLIWLLRHTIGALPGDGAAPGGLGGFGGGFSGGGGATGSW